MTEPCKSSPATPVSAWLSHATGKRELAHHAATRSRSGMQVRGELLQRTRSVKRACVRAVTRRACP